MAGLGLPPGRQRVVDGILALALPAALDDQGTHQLSRGLAGLVLARVQGCRGQRDRARRSHRVPEPGSGHRPVAASLSATRCGRECPEPDSNRHDLTVKQF
jgi:hypothetical protein